jgi:hypothetical protein
MFPFSGWQRELGLNTMFPLCNNNAFRLCMEESTNSCLSCGLYLMFIVVIRPSTILHALISSCVIKTAQNLFDGSEILSLSHCHTQDSTVEVLNTTVPLYSLKVLGL